MSPDSMTSGWYYAKAGAAPGHEVGPLSWEELYLLTRDGSLSPEDLVWNPKLPHGVAAGTVPGLFTTVQVPDPVPASLPAQVESTPAAQPTAAVVQQTPTPQPQAESWADATSAETLPTPGDDADVSRSPADENETRNSRLPLLVVLLAIVVAAVGLVAYFLFFRDSLIDQQSALQTAVTLARALAFGL